MKTFFFQNQVGGAPPPQSTGETTTPLRALFSNQDLDQEEDTQVRMARGESRKENLLYRDQKPRSSNTGFSKGNHNNSISVPAGSNPVMYPFMKMYNGTPPYYGVAPPEYPVPLLQKTYEFHAHPIDMRETVNSLRQDLLLLPDLVGSAKFATVTARNVLYTALRNLIFQNMDGLEIPLSTGANRAAQLSLLSVVKVLQQDPLHFREDKAHQYQPPFAYDTLIYKSAYPMRYRNSTGQTAAAPEHTNLNLRFYKLNKAEYLFPVIPYLCENDFYAWRELTFYNTVRRLLGTKTLDGFSARTPHVVLPVGHLICTSNIDFDKINKISNDTGYGGFQTAKKTHLYTRLGQYENDAKKAPMCLYAGVSATGIVILVDPDKVLLVRNKFTGLFETLVHPLCFRVEKGDSGAINWRLAAIENAIRHAGSRLRNNLDRDSLTGPVDYDVDGFTQKVYFTKLDKDKIKDDPDIKIIPLAEYANTFVAPATNKLLKETIGTIPKTVAELKGWKPYSLTHNGGNDDTRHKPQYKEIKEKDPNWLTENSGRSLIIVTESPTNTFMQWTSRRYADEWSRVQKMERMGIYSDATWETVLFQIIQGAYEMLRAGFTIKHMNLKTNVCIKDVQQNPKKFWNYCVKGIPFSIPNHGYIVLLDIVGNKNTMGNRVILPGEDLSDQTMKKIFVELIDPVVFNNPEDYVTNRPSQHIIELMDKLKTEFENAKDPILDEVPKILLGCFKQFVNKTVGKLYNNRNYLPEPFPVTTPKAGDFVFLLNVFDDTAPPEVVAFVNTSTNNTATIVRRDGDDKVLFDKVSLGDLRTISKDVLQSIQQQDPSRNQQNNRNFDNNNNTELHKPLDTYGSRD